MDQRGRLNISESTCAAHVPVVAFMDAYLYFGGVFASPEAHAKRVDGVGLFEGGVCRIRKRGREGKGNGARSRGGLGYGPRGGGGEGAGPERGGVEAGGSGCLTERESGDMDEAVSYCSIFGFSKCNAWPTFPHDVFTPKKLGHSRVKSTRVWKTRHRLPSRIQPEVMLPVLLLRAAAAAAAETPLTTPA
jgi:hypothetical protein